ncbi:hypothetical protein Lser_V15G07266 [Lactuca serriola]
MNRCTGSTMMGPCSCGLYHYQQNSFSSIFPIPYEEEIMCPYSSSPSSVDCTLSLGTPSTRLTNDHEKRRGSNWWNILQSSSHSSAPSAHKSNRGGDGNGNGNGNGSAAADSLFSRRCANCDTTSTPLWRNGPRGPKSLCNACGIRYKKEERRANAAAAAVVSNGGSDSTEGYHHHQYMMNNGNQWMNHSQSTYKMPSCYSTASAASNEYRFMDDVDDRDSPFLSWRLNVTDRPGLVHDFTR